MSICPMEYRYGSPEMRRVFSREAMIRRMVRVEAALMKGLEAAGLAPRECWERLEACGETISPSDVDGLEARIGHDTAALALLLAERCGGCGGYVHLGATSNDIIDTAWSLALRDALALVRRRLASLISVLSEMAEKHSGLIMAGRTHGQHALPVTLGFKAAVYVYELSRSMERLCDAERRVVRGKMSGAVGTMAAWGSRGTVVEEEAMRHLGLEPHAITTQVAPRDGLAEIVADLAILGSQLDRLAIEIRELSRPEIGELREKPPGTVGSSTMPHKANPIRSERVSSLARLLRGLVAPALENIALWHERDLTNSANERIIIPHAFLALDEMLCSMEQVLRDLVIDEDAMRRNLELGRGALLSESLVVRLVEKGVPRPEAYRRVQELVRRASRSGASLLQEALRDPLVSEKLSPREVSEALSPEKYLGSVDKLIRRALSYAAAAAERCPLGAEHSPGPHNNP